MDNLNNGQNQYSPDIMSFQNSQNNQYNQFDQINQYNQYDQQNTYTGDNGNYDGVSSALTEDNLDSNFANKPAKTKSGSKKFVLFGIIAFLAVIIGIAVFYFISIFTESFEVNDLDKVNEACDEVFDKTIEVKDYAGPFVVGGVEYAVKRQGIIRGDIDNVVWSVYWTEFDDESNAKKFLAQYEESIDERHDKLKDTIGDSS